MIGLEGETTGHWHLMIGLEGETTGQWYLMIGLEGETTGQWHLMIGLEGETTSPIGTNLDCLASQSFECGLMGFISENIWYAVTYILGIIDLRQMQNYQYIQNISF